MGSSQAIESGFARVFGAQPALPSGQLVTIECDIVRGLHAFTIVGLPDKAVEEAKDRIAAAIKNTDGDFESPKRSNKKIVFSLAPAELKKEGSAFDLPLALGFLLASEQIEFDPSGKLFAGELALDGSVRGIRGTLSIALAARDEGFSELFVPAENADEAALVPGITVYPVRTLRELLTHLHPNTKTTIPAHQRAPHTGRRRRDDDRIALSDIRGQETAKRGLEIAAAGGHNIALYGPPGTGKTMLARVAVSLLPPLSEEEMIEVTAIHSLAGTLAGSAVFDPPLRSPHHTSSYASLIGGGTIPKPGEVTLAHRGILFLDEFAEFHRDVVNALREPLEDAKVSVSRVRGSSVFPANFMLIAALNPCPCGKYGSRDCRCSHTSIERYKRKISGPVADRIDMWVQVGEMRPEELSMQKKSAKTDETEKARQRIAAAREKQRERFKTARGINTNADMGPKELENLAQLSAQAEKSLIGAARTLKLSPRGYHRTIKLARTIADLAESSAITEPHMMEALQYRVREI
ncbi:MAG TPA: YifB family Mg chelatase-like AAA ATPase [Candidatus Paceibacterota bacterium]|nr:YifB family Mg chelatase-like AAA ATPase [Candidatus Paceibacterota bacterium]